jgi:Inner membrane component of T3SS, cytoplasmic domain/Domain of unknown function (DUF1707)
MAGSAADTPTTPEFFRVSDAEREHAVDELKQEFVHGRLSQDTFLVRMNAALGARNQGQLSGLFTDLPPRRSLLARAADAARNWRRQTRDAIADGAAAVASPVRKLVPRQQPVRYDDEPGNSGYVVRSGLAGPPAPLVFPPGPDTSFTIGRDHRCDLYIEDMSVSRLHARLARGAEGWQLTDLGSTNGTRLNGWRVRTAVPVRPGDHIRFGSATFVVQQEPSPSG